MNTPSLNQEESREVNQTDESEDNLVNLNAVWTLVVIVIAIFAAVYLAYISGQVEFL